MKPNWEELGRVLTAARGSRKAAPVARAVGISPTQLRNYERAIPTSGRPPMERLLALAEYYGIEDPQPWLDLAGYEAGAPAKSNRSDDARSGVGPEPSSEGSPSIQVIDNGVGLESGRNVVTVKIAALGLEASSTFTDSEDRARVIADIIRALGLEGFGK